MFSKIFGILLLFVLFDFLLGFAILRRLFREIFGIKPPYQQHSKQSHTNQKRHQSNTTSASKKIIASDEGEYVDYVEIKD